MTMPARINFVVALNRVQDVSHLSAQFLMCFSAHVVRWQVIDRDHLVDMNTGDLRRVLDNGLVVLAVTNIDPAVRVHLSRVGVFDVLTISTSGYDNERVACAVMEVVNRVDDVIEAGVGEEAEMEVDLNGHLKLVGDNVRVLAIREQPHVRRVPNKPNYPQR